MVRRTGLIDTAVGELRERIETEQWPVGTRIPPEPALVDLLGVGRNTVREAVQSLVHAGLLERRQGSGTYVLSASELAASMGRQIADARQRDVVEVRRALEAEAARLASRRRTALDAAALMDRRDERAVAYLAADLDAIGENIRFNFVTDAHGHDAHDILVEAIVAGDDAKAGGETARYLSALLGE